MSPIRPEDRDRYPADWPAVGVPVDEVLPGGVLTAARALRAASGFDPLRSDRFWEHAVALLIGGEVTAAKSPYDVAVPDGPRVEVKFSAEFTMRLGFGAPRSVYRWTGLSGGPSQRKGDDIVTVLIGVDRSDRVSMWTIPRWAVDGTNTATIVVPGQGHGGDTRSGLRGHATYPPDLLRDVLIVAGGCHLAYDREHHAETRAQTIRTEREAAGQTVIEGAA